ncbi:RidA family protein [uncultured Bradyrhizobium sp.]|uniref:RidA family protein n=1 Tax=uncultured Bradyrhizobium sp. TaxID=199684 RepID=UPI0035CB41C9
MNERAHPPSEERSLASMNGNRRTGTTRAPRARDGHVASQRIFVTSGKGVPPSLAGISHAVAAGPFCHTGGQLAIDSNGRLVQGSAGTQARLAFRNLFAVLAAAGFSRSDVVFVDIALTDIDELAEVNIEFHRVFPRQPRPARAVLQASVLPLRAKVRLYGVAIRNQVSSN